MYELVSELSLYLSFRLYFPCSYIWNPHLFNWLFPSAFCLSCVFFVFSFCFYSSAFCSLQRVDILVRVYRNSWDSNRVVKSIRRGLRINARKRLRTFSMQEIERRRKALLEKSFAALLCDVGYQKSRRSRKKRWRSEKGERKHLLYARLIFLGHDH